MGIETVAYIALASTIASTAAQYSAQQKAAGEQEKAQKEQQAMNAAKAAQERRQQIREERVRQARLLQASENTGATDSSGQIGAEGSLATQLQSNVGFNLGALRSAGNISRFNQNAADYLEEAQMWKAVGQISQSIFSAGAASGTTSAATTAPANISRGGSFSTSQ